MKDEFDICWETGNYEDQNCNEYPYAYECSASGVEDGD